MVSMNKLSPEKRAAVVRCLVEGSSIRATVRMTGAAKNTVANLLVDLGTACREFHDRMVRNVTTKRVQADEVWAFCYAKEKNVPADKKGLFGYGDVWTWTAIDADSKLCLSWMIGRRDTRCATQFMRDVAGRLANRVQLTTDGHKPYLLAVERAFGGDIDYAVLQKLYGQDSEGQRRYTRLTNAFSKKVENLMAAVSLHFTYYNWCRIHQTLRVTPAMEAGLTTRLYEVEDLVALLEPAGNLSPN